MTAFTLSVIVPAIIGRSLELISVFDRDRTAAKPVAIITTAHHNRSCLSLTPLRSFHTARSLLLYLLPTLTFLITLVTLSLAFLQPDPVATMNMRIFAVAAIAGKCPSTPKSPVTFLLTHQQ